MQTKNGLPFSNKKKEESLVTLTTQMANVNTQLAQSMTEVNLNKYKDYVVNGDWTPAIMQAHSEWVSGDVLVIDRPITIKTPVTWTKKANIKCIGDKGYIVLEVGSTQDGITIKGMTINSVDIKLNIYGLASCCKNALVVDSLNLSNVQAKIKAGAVEYGYVSKGCLLTKHDVHISTNYASPLANAAMPTKHILLETGTALISESNACKFNLRLEGGGDGVTKTNTSNLETVEFTGTIEGLAGRAFNINKAQYINIHNIHLELNNLESIFSDIKNIEVGSAVRNNTMKMKFVNSQGIVIDGYSGSLEFDSTCTGLVKQIALETNDVIVNNSKGVFVDGTIVNFSDSARQSVTSIGKNIPENLFHNPFIDIWTNGNNAIPDGFVATTVTYSKETSIVYSENPSKVSAYCQQSGATIADGARALLKSATNLNSERWVSVTVPIYVATGQPNVRVFIYDVDQFRLLTTVTEKDKWVLVCGSAKVNANKNIAIQITAHNGSAYVAGNYYVGGITAINGNVASRYLLDHGKRSEHIVTSITNPPAFLGQRALVGGIFYMAKGTSASTDWVALN